MPRRWLALAAGLAGLAVAAGAFGAHALRGRLAAPDLEIFETAARYQMYHALALLAVSVLSARADARLLRWSRWAFLTGVLVFSGSLYLLALSGLRWLGALTPIGGAAFLLGWGCLAAWALSEARSAKSGGTGDPSGA